MNIVTKIKSISERFKARCKLVYSGTVGKLMLAGDMCLGASVGAILAGEFSLGAMIAAVGMGFCMVALKKLKRGGK